jgi:hypothetical protein
LIGGFYKACWSIIKADLVGAIQQLFDLRADAWELLNSANVTLIAKKDGAKAVSYSTYELTLGSFSILQT